MKKLKLLLLLFPLAVASCGSYDDDGNYMNPTYSPNFSTLCTHNNVTYLRDVDTDMIYLLYRGSKFENGLTIYYNSEGKPMTYEEFKVVHNTKYHS